MGSSACGGHYGHARVTSSAASACSLKNGCDRNKQRSHREILSKAVIHSRKETGQRVILNEVHLDDRNCSNIMRRIAALITSYNRVEKTMACLSALKGQVLPQGASLEVYLVDDASSDGTAETVAARFPEVNILQGTGSLFWNGAMRIAFAEACRGDYDSYLWVNEDTVLAADAIARLLKCEASIRDSGKGKIIVVGSICSAHTGELTYGGFVRCSWLHPMKYKMVSPEAHLIEVETMNGNCVLVTAEAAKVTGNLGASFTHGIGDFDYGLRARAAGCSVWLADGFVGTCERDTLGCAFQGKWVSWRDYWGQILGPKGLPPKEWRTYVGLHGGPLWPIYWILPYIRFSVTAITEMVRARWGRSCKEQ